MVTSLTAREFQRAFLAVYLLDGGIAIGATGRVAGLCKSGDVP